MAIVRAAAVLCALALGFPASAQVRVLDEGSFTLYRDGDRVGREDFSIREAPGADGRMLVAQATVATGSRRVTPSVNTDTAGSPLRYQREVRDSGVVTETYTGVATGMRYASLLVTPEGESAREFLLPHGTVAADDDIIHQIWFVVRAAAGKPVPVLAPRRNAVDSVSVESAGAERISIDLRQFDTTHLVLHTKGAGAPREVWVDRAGRIIKALVPAFGLLALRD